jgi:hypothetical protein
MSNFLARWQDGKKTTYDQKERISAVTLYLFYIRKVFLEGTPKSLTAFFTVYQWQIEKSSIKKVCILFFTPLGSRVKI